MLAVLIVLLVLVLIAVVVLIVIMQRRRTPETPAPAPPADPFSPAADVAGDPRSIKAGDMIEYLGVRYFVRGSVRLREGGFTWSEHLLDADTIAGTKVWVSVEEDPDLEVVWWNEHDIGDLVPDQRDLTLDGVDYRREEHGTADYRTEGTTGLGDTGQVEYVDYEGSGGRYLSFERYGGGSWKGVAWELGVGERVPTGTMTIYPGS